MKAFGITAIALLLAAGLAQANGTDPTADAGAAPDAPAADATEPEAPSAKPPVAPLPTDACGSADYQDYIGQPAEAVEALEFEGPVRIIPEGGAVTLDFLPHRINFALDEDGNVVRVSCG